MVSAFDCAARNKLFGVRKEEEIVVIRNVLGREVSLFGFYTYGEQTSLGVFWARMFFRFPQRN